MHPSAFLVFVFTFFVVIVVGVLGGEERTRKKFGSELCAILLVVFLVVAVVGILH